MGRCDGWSVGLVAAVAVSTISQKERGRLAIVGAQLAGGLGRDKSDEGSRREDEEFVISGNVLEMRRRRREKGRRCARVRTHGSGGERCRVGGEGVRN